MRLSMYASFVSCGLLFASVCALGQAEPAASASDDPVIAGFGQSDEIRLRQLEEFVHELPSQQRIPLISDTLNWVDMVSRELARDIVCTSQALEKNYQQDPRFLRARGYFCQEYLSYVMLRDNVINRIDATPGTLQKIYLEHTNDFYLSPTVSMRLIRTRSRDNATSALAQIQAGRAFEEVEKEVSEASPLQRGKVLGPLPNPRNRQSIPPPAQVIAAGLASPVGQTTGPIQVGANYFVIRVEGKTEGRLRNYEEVADMIEATIRNIEGDRLNTELVAKLREELHVEQDDAAVSNPATRPEDVIATVGRVKLPYQEYLDLNGHVRGPAMTAARLQKGKLSQFITPHILAEGAWVRGYAEQPDFRKTLYYWDIQHMGTSIYEELVDKQMPSYTEQDMRNYYEQHLEDYKAKYGKRKLSFELLRDIVEEAMRNGARPEAEKKVQSSLFGQINYRLAQGAVCSRLSAFDALAAAQEKLPADARLVSISTRLDKDDSKELQPTALSECGRRTAWRIVYSRGEPTSQTCELIVNTPGRIYRSSREVAAVAPYKSWQELWKFDTDAMARHAFDAGLSDFVAKYAGKVHIDSSVEFEWKDGQPKDAWIVIEARPVDRTVQDAWAMRYLGRTGESQRERKRECLSCPDEPTIASAASTTASDTATSK